MGRVRGYIHFLLLTAMYASTVSGTYGPYYHHILAPPHEKCPTGSWAKSRCRRDFGDCEPGFTCVTTLPPFPAPGLPQGICCPKYRKCPLWGDPGPMCGLFPPKPLCPFGHKCKHKMPVCPAGSLEDGVCHKMLSCRPGFQCLKGFCCSLPEPKLVCPPDFFVLDGLKCGQHVHCPGKSLCLDFRCCHPRKLIPIIHAKPMSIPAKPRQPTRLKPRKPRPPKFSKPKKKSYVPDKKYPPTTVKTFAQPKKLPPLKLPTGPPPGSFDLPATPIAPPSAPPLITGKPMAPLPSTCPNGLQRLEGWNCGHILSCPGNSLCISGVCCATSDIGKCPINHERIRDINCSLRQRCPTGSHCISGVCCIPPAPPSCPVTFVHVVHLSCELGTCTGSNICVSGICCTTLPIKDIPVPVVATLRAVNHPPSTLPPIARFDQRPDTLPVIPTVIHHFPTSQSPHSHPQPLPFTQPTIRPPLIQPKAPNLSPVNPNNFIPTNIPILPPIPPSLPPIHFGLRPLTTTSGVPKPPRLQKDPFPIFPYPNTPVSETLIPLSPVKDPAPSAIRITKMPPSTSSSMPINSKTPSAMPHARVPLPTPFIPVVHIHNPTFPPPGINISPMTVPTRNESVPAIPKIPAPLPKTPSPKIHLYEPTFPPSGITSPPMTVLPYIPTVPHTFSPPVPPLKVFKTPSPTLLTPYTKRQTSTSVGIALPPQATLPSITLPPMYPAGSVIPQKIPPTNKPAFIPAIPATQPPKYPPNPTVLPTQPPKFQPIPTVPPTQTPLFQPIPTVPPTQPPKFQPFPTVPPTKPPKFQSIPTVPPTQPPIFQSIPTVSPTQPPIFQPMPTVKPTQPPKFLSMPTDLPTLTPKFQSIPTVPPTQPPIFQPMPTAPPTLPSIFPPNPTVPPSKLITFPPIPTVPLTQPPNVPPNPTTPPTQPPTYPPALIPTAPSIQPPTYPPALIPTAPPTQPPTYPPALMPTAPPTQPPTYPPALIPTAPPTQPPTYPPALIPTAPPTQPPKYPLIPSASPTRPPTVPAYLPPIIPRTFSPLPVETVRSSGHLPTKPPNRPATVPSSVSTPVSLLVKKYVPNPTINVQNVISTASPQPSTRQISPRFHKTNITYPPLLPPIDMTFPPEPPTFANIRIRTTTLPTRFITTPQATNKVPKTIPTTPYLQFVQETTPTTKLQPIALTCPSGNISIPGLSCDNVYRCPAGSTCYSGICCLSVERVQVPACPVDFLSSNPCPSPPEADLCTVDQDCGPYMVCCLTSCDQRVCRPMVAPQQTIPR